MNHSMYRSNSFFYDENETRFGGVLLPFVGGLLVGGLFAPSLKGGTMYSQPVVPISQPYYQPIGVIPQQPLVYQGPTYIVPPNYSATGISEYTYSPFPTQNYYYGVNPTAQSITNGPYQV